MSELFDRATRLERMERRAWGDGRSPLLRQMEAVIAERRLKPLDCRVCRDFDQDPSGLGFGWCSAHRCYAKLYHPAGEWYAPCQFKDLRRLRPQELERDETYRRELAIAPPDTSERPPPLPSARRASESLRVAIIGGGIAGQAVAEAVRELDADIPVTLLCGESRLPYDRVRLTDLLASGETAEGLGLRPREWYEDRRIDVELGAHVVDIDMKRKVIRTRDGRVRRFGRACLATGSEPLLPPIAGLDRSGVHAFRSPEDCDAIRAGAAGAARAAVIGGGLLGLEAARGVAAQGCAVTVVHLMDRLMERQLDSRAALALDANIRRLGIDVLYERQTTEVLGGERVEGLRFATGDEVPCDLVVVSVGIKPRIEVARMAGVRCDRGVVVDDSLRTSHEDLFAVGECAEHSGIVYGIVAPIHEQARVAAFGLTDHEAAEPYRGSVMATKLKVMGVDLVTVGEPEGDGQAIVEDAAAGVYRKLVTRGGRICGAILLGDTRGHELVQEQVRDAAPCDDPLTALTKAKAARPQDLPDAAQVCNCNGVSKGEILSAIRAGGLTSTTEVVSVTRAGAGCGSCKGAVADILRSERGQVDEAAYVCPCRRLTKEELAKSVRRDGLEAVSDIVSVTGAGRDCGDCKPALAYVVSEMHGNRHREERSARFINDRVHANIQKDGTFSVVPRIYGGVTSPGELRRIAAVAEKYEVPMVKITGGQRIDLLGVAKEDLPAVWEELGMPSGHAYAKAVRTVKTCVGSRFCRFGLDAAIDFGIELERKWEGLHTPHKVKAAVSGCPRNCAEASTKDIGAIAVEGGWQIRVGGAAGGAVREGDVLETVAERDAAERVMTTFLQFYREGGEYMERTHRFVERLGIDAVRDAVLAEETGEPEALRRRLEIAKSAVSDPWLERRDPVHSKQFAELDSNARPSTLTREEASR